MQKRIFAFDGLRALACLSIVFFHCGVPLMGTEGVTFFFLLSGFLMYYINSECITIIGGG